MYPQRYNNGFKVRLCALNREKLHVCPWYITAMESGIYIPYLRYCRRILEGSTPAERVSGVEQQAFSLLDQSSSVVTPLQLFYFPLLAHPSEKPCSVSASYDPFLCYLFYVFNTWTRHYVINYIICGWYYPLKCPGSNGRPKVSLHTSIT